MDKPTRETEPIFSQPVRQLTIMLIVTILVMIAGYLAWPRVSGVFEANPYLNAMILTVFFIGVLACFLQVTQLFSSVSWLVDFTKHVPGHGDVKAPRLLAPLAQLLRGRGARSQISSTSAGSILDSVATRIDEARDITRYIINMLILLGLLGTFWGLATTVPAVVATIKSLAPKEGETALDVFSHLMGGLQSQLGGMGTSFSSSLLGLAGSLVLGLLELFAGHGQNRFYRELEEWLSSITRLGLAGDGDGGLDQGTMIAVFDHMSEQMDALQTLFAQSDIARAATDDRLAALTETVGRLTERLAAQGDGGARALDRLAEGQARSVEGQEKLIAALRGRSDSQAQAAEEQDKLIAALRGLADGQDRIAQAQDKLIAALRGRADTEGEHVDAESRMRLRSIDVQLLRILEEISAGRQESITDLRGDLAALTAAIRQLSRIGPPPTGRS